VNEPMASPCWLRPNHKENKHDRQLDARSTALSYAGATASPG
jgi:hypothetical protein